MSQVLPEPVSTVDSRWTQARPGDVRSVLRQHASGVAVITAGAPSPVGFCATSFATLSLEPPMVSFAIGVQTNSWGTVATAAYVMAHLLADDQGELARRFGRPGSAKFAPPVRWHRDEFGLPLLHGVLAWLVLEPVAQLPVVDHVLVVCRVIRVGVAENAQSPLVNQAGRYWSLTE
jgi:flavin reductase (DIM6/NTAB) family NADH-FMN oxidoreductase RutF